MNQNVPDKELNGAALESAGAGELAAIRSTRALIYLRVSSTGQLGGDFDRDGFSLPAQAEACIRKAESLEADIAEEPFVERGESGTSTAGRPALAAMLKRLEQGGIDYVIVHKIDRLARNRADDVAIVAQIRASGAQLVSVSENIDETPSGLLLHGIMSSIAEFYSKNLAAEVVKGTVEKAKKGGTPFKAPLGYLNQRMWITDDGTPVASGNELAREIRTITVDPERAEHIQAAFSLYATGNYALSDLAAILEERGFRTRASRTAPAQAVGISRLQELLRKDYYIGVVRYRGQVYDGRHPPLTDAATFQRVQEVLDSQRKRGTTAWRHHHFLTSTLFCADCGRRLVYSRNTGNGGLYEYFVCTGRQHGVCAQAHHRVAAVEAAVEDHYAQISLTERQRQAVEHSLRSRLEAIAGETSAETGRAQEALMRLKSQERKLMAAHYADQISPELFAEEQARVRRERVAAEMTIQRLDVQADKIGEGLTASLALITDVHRAYVLSDATQKRLITQAIFDRLEVSQEDISNGRINRPFRDYVDVVASSNDGANRGRRAESRPETQDGVPKDAAWPTFRTFDPVSAAEGSNYGDMVGETGFEPATARPPAGCATRLRHSPRNEKSTGATSLTTAPCPRTPSSSPAGRRRRRGATDGYCLPALPRPRRRPGTAATADRLPSRLPDAD